MGWLARTNSGRKESESLVQPGPRLSDIAEELEGDLVLWDIPNPDVRSGSFTDVYPGTWASLEGKTIVVAVKLVRTTRHFAPNEITLKKKIGLVSPLARDRLFPLSQKSLIPFRTTAYETRNSSMDSYKTQEHTYPIGI